MLIIARVKGMMAQQMSSEAVGVQRIIKNNSSEKIQKNTHCCGHNLALNICTACKLVIRNVLDTVKDTCMFVRGSKKMSLLRDVVKNNPHFSEHQQPIFDICVTRWVENLDGYNMFLIVYAFIIEALEFMALKLHLEKYRLVKIRSRKSISHNRVLGSLRNFCFLIVRTIMVKYLSYIKGPIRKIQDRSLDLYEIVDVIRNTQTGVMLLRSEESDFYQKYYDYVIHVCNLIVVENSS